MNTHKPTYIVRQQGMTAVWFANHIVSAWYDSDGGRANLWKAYVVTKAAAQNEDSDGYVYGRGLDGMLAP